MSLPCHFTMEMTTPRPQIAWQRPSLCPQAEAHWHLSFISRAMHMPDYGLGQPKSEDQLICQSSSVTCSMRKGLSLMGVLQGSWASWLESSRVLPLSAFPIPPVSAFFPMWVLRIKVTSSHLEGRHLTRSTTLHPFKRCLWLLFSVTADLGRFYRRPTVCGSIAPLYLSRDEAKLAGHCSSHVTLFPSCQIP